MPEIRELTGSVKQLSSDVHDLGDDTRELRAELAKVKSELNKQVIDTRMAIAAAIALVIIVAVGAFVVSLDNRQAIAESEAKWCPLLDRLAPRAGAPAPAGTAEQREYALETRRLLAELADRNGCR